MNVQVKELLQEGIEVIFVTSGAVGVGRQKLRHQLLMNSRCGFGWVDPSLNCFFAAGMDAMSRKRSLPRRAFVMRPLTISPCGRSLRCCLMF